MPVGKDYTFTWVHNSVVQLSLFQRKNRWSMAWVHGPVGDGSQRIGSGFWPKPTVPKKPKNRSKGPMIMLSFKNQK
jgi:hypothetical protein